MSIVYLQIRSFRISYRPQSKHLFSIHAKRENNHKLLVICQRSTGHAGKELKRSFNTLLIFQWDDLFYLLCQKSKLVYWINDGITTQTFMQHSFLLYVCVVWMDRSFMRNVQSCEHYRHMWKTIFLPKAREMEQKKPIAGLFWFFVSSKTRSRMCSLSFLFLSSRLS